MRQKPLRDSLQSIWQLLLKPPRSPKTRKIWETAIAKKSLRRHYNWRNCSVLPHRINLLWECGTTKGHQVKSQEVYIRCKLQLITMYTSWSVVTSQRDKRVDTVWPWKAHSKFSTLAPTFVAVWPLSFKFPQIVYQRWNCAYLMKWWLTEIVLKNHRV